MNSSTTKKYLILGLDGLDLDRPGHEALSQMPYLSGLVDRYGSDKSDAVLPNNSLACWQTWFTGCDPSYHGIPDMFILDEATGFYRIVNSSDRAVPALWDIASEKGLRSIVFNVPGTFPASPLSGLMVAGFPVLSKQGLTFPTALPPHINRLFDDYRNDLEYRVAEDERVARQDTVDSMKEILEYHLKIMDVLLREEWDIFIGVITMLDRLLHYFYPVFADPARFGGEISRTTYECLRVLDDFIRNVVNEWGKKAKILLVSDHGFQECLFRFHLADWLEQQGWFYREEVRASQKDSHLIDIVKADTRRSVFIPAPASSIGLRVNQKMKHGQGKEKMINELWQRLKEVEGPDSQPVVDRLIKSADLYDGPHLSALPDVFVIAREGKVALTSKPGNGLFDEPIRQGIHSLHSYCLVVGDKLVEKGGWRTLIEYYNLLFGGKSRPPKGGLR